MPRVIQLDRMRSDFDVSDLERFGSLVDLSSNMPSPFQVETYEQSIVDELERINFAPKFDYIVMIGRTLNLSLGLVSVARKWGKCKLLLFSASENRYIEKQL